jgi:hypothetical protein
LVESLLGLPEYLLLVTHVPVNPSIDGLALVQILVSIDSALLHGLVASPMVYGLGLIPL